MSAETVAVEEFDESQVTPANAGVHGIFPRGFPPTAAAKVDAQFDGKPDSAYAYAAVGNALAAALSEAAARRPDDPVEFVAQRLLNYRRTVDHCRQRDAEVEAYRQERIRQLQEEARQRAIAEELRLQREEEERRKREELERLRHTVPLESIALPSKLAETRAKNGATPLHTAVRGGCDVDTLLRMLHEGHSFAARDAQGLNVRDAALAAKNDAVVKEIDSLVVRWLREEKVDYLRWLLAADYGNSLPNLKKAFGPKLKGLPEASRRLIDSVAQCEARYRELWRLSAKGTREHLEQHCRQLRDQGLPEDAFARTREGLSALHIALLCKNVEAVRYLVTEYPDLVRLGDNFARLPIHYAHGAGQNFVEIVGEQQQQQQQQQKSSPLDAFGFAPAVYAKRYELLPEPPNYASPEPVPESGDNEANAENPNADGTTTADAVVGEEGGASSEADQSKLTPINEDEGEEN